MALEQFNSHAN